jgi:hypothetical protein
MGHSFDADHTADGLVATARARNPGPQRAVIQLGPADDLAIIATS